MIESLPDVPPACKLLLVEVLAKSKDWGDARRRLKELLPELRDQSEVYETSCIGQAREIAVPGSLDVYLDGGLNLLDRSTKAGCLDFRCRRAAAERITRSLGLIADTIWITDFWTEKFCRFGRVTNQKLDEVLEDLLVLEVLLPLILSGVVRFRTPWIAACSNCLEHFEKGVDEITDKLMAQFGDRFSFRPLSQGEGFAIDTGDLFEPSIVVRLMPGPKRLGWPPNADECRRDLVRESVHAALWVGREAALGGGSVFSNSRAGLAGLAVSEGRVRSRSELQLLDDRRSISLPWVSDLSPAQIVQLRQEASKALPLLREMLARRLTWTDNVSREDISNHLVSELREQAVEVRNELELTQRHAKRLWDTPYSLLAFGVSAYGLATDQPATAALGGLLSLLQLVVSHKAGTEKEIDKLQRRPGFVLVKAQEILAHAH